ncbi:MAG TPA: hypothetical protein DCL41_08280 [Bdellovibrionales bacterium]|nr:hypothetical protein [Pseudobdellovibrionaceae bacterium]HAG91854.1 hypothetical protein [Bdellovibrionales bacterium]|tara:strand:+ start:1091 stop:1534 length:444 start_codon:yes stop_codon:yes gene_type:complete
MIFERLGQLIILLTLICGPVAFSQTTPIDITTISSLDFGSALPGDPALTLPNVNSETDQNASFYITGQKNTSFTLSLPAEGTVQMITGTGVNLNQKISVTGFNYKPNNLKLSKSGDLYLYVSATRAALSTDQVPGYYSTSFIITVIY